LEFWVGSWNSLFKVRILGIFWVWLRAIIVPGCCLFAAGANTHLYSWYSMRQFRIDTKTGIVMDFPKFFFLKSWHVPIAAKIQKLKKVFHI